MNWLILYYYMPTATSAILRTRRDVVKIHRKNYNIC